MAIFIQRGELYSESILDLVTQSYKLWKLACLFRRKLLIRSGFLDRCTEWGGNPDSLYNRNRSSPKKTLYICSQSRIIVIAEKYLIELTEEKMKLYKLTNRDGTTHGGYVYGVVGVTHTKSPVESPRLCTGDVFHAYRDPTLAFMLNSLHANFTDPVLWEIDGDVVTEDWGKCGSFTQTVIRQLPTPAWVGSDAEHRVRVMFAVLCAEQVLPLFERECPGDFRPREAVRIARDFVEGRGATPEQLDQTAEAAWAAWTAWAAAEVVEAARTTAWAAWTAWAAGGAARAAAEVVEAARTTAWAAWAAGAAEWSAWAAEWAARSVDRTEVSIDFANLANQAVEHVMKVE